MRVELTLEQLADIIIVFGNSPATEGRRAVYNYLVERYNESLDTTTGDSEIARIIRRRRRSSSPGEAEPYTPYLGGDTPVLNNQASSAGLVARRIVSRSSVPTSVDEDSI